MDRPRQQAVAAVPVFKCVPFFDQWYIAGTKLDVRAIYRRPSRRIGEFDEIIPVMGDDGLPLWDLTGALPVRRHSDWLAKGFQYVTLADMKSLEDVSPYLRKQGINPAEYIQHPAMGPWNPKLYMATAHDADVSALEELAALVDALGSDAVTTVRRTVEPHFQLPPHLQGILPAGRRPTPPTETAPTDKPAARAAARKRPSRAKAKEIVGANEG